jgi:hypothetical protein
MFAGIRKLFGPGSAPEVELPSASILSKLSKTEQTKLQAIQEAMTGDTDLAEMLGIPLDRLMELAAHMPAVRSVTMPTAIDGTSAVNPHLHTQIEALEAAVATLRAENARLQQELSLLREDAVATTSVLREQNRRDSPAAQVNTAIDAYLRSIYAMPTKG